MYLRTKDIVRTGNTKSELSYLQLRIARRNVAAAGVLCNTINNKFVLLKLYPVLFAIVWTLILL